MFPFRELIGHHWGTERCRGRERPRSGARPSARWPPGSAGFAAAGGTAAGTELTGLVPALEPAFELTRAGERGGQFDLRAGGDRGAHERRAGAREMLG